MTKKDWRLLQAYKATGLTPEQVAQIKKERDAVIEDIKSCRGDICTICANFVPSEDTHCDCECLECENRCKCWYCDAKYSGFVWRGVKEE